MTIHETLAPLTIPLGSVTRYPGNARAHQLDRLRESLRANSQYRPIVVNRRTMQILAGNGTHEAAEQEGWTEIAATFVDVDDEQAQRILLVDNPPPSHPGYDDALLLELLQGLPDIGGTGYTSDELAALEAALDPTPFDPAREWTGMPEYESKDLRSVFHTIVHFKSDEDAEAFFRRIERPKQKSLWWPESDGHIGSDARSAYVGVDGAGDAAQP